MAKNIRALVTGLARREAISESDLPAIRLYEAITELERVLGVVAESAGVGGRHYSRANSSGGLVIVTATPTALALDQTVYQNASIHDNTTGQNTKFTAQRSGFYHAFGNVQWPPNATGLRTIQIRKGGSSIVASRNDLADGTNDRDQFVTTGVYLEIGDYIEIVVTQTSGGNLTIPVVANFSPEGALSEF